MLPFLKNKMEGSVSQAVESKQRKSDDEEAGLELDGLEIAMKELFESKSPKEQAAAFRAAFDLLEQEPHEEEQFNG